jgi:hypothetical protein
VTLTEPVCAQVMLTVLFLVNDSNDERHRQSYKLFRLKERQKPPEEQTDMSAHEDLFFFIYKACMQIKNRKLELCFPGY